MFRFLRLFAALVLIVLTVGAAPPRAWAAPAASAVSIEATLSPESTLTVTETVDFAEAPAEFVQKLTTLRTDRASGQQYQFTIFDVVAKVDAKPAEVALAQTPDHVQITVPTSNAKKLTLTYRARGMILAQSGGGTHLVWPLWHGASIPASQVSGNLSLPYQHKDYLCHTGPVEAPRLCTKFQGGVSQQAGFSFDVLSVAPEHLVEVDVSFGPGVVAPTEVTREPWSLDRAFSVDLVPLLAALAAALLGLGFLWWLWLRGKDARFDAVRPVAHFAKGREGIEFLVLDGIRPGHVGTLVDERVDPLDIAATLLDLAVRGHLRITELGATSGALPEWHLFRRPSEVPLLDFERTLLDVIPTEGATLAHLADALTVAVPTIQRQLYEEMVQRGWFRARPDQVRRGWGRHFAVAFTVGVLGLAALVAFTPYGLAGLAVLAVIAAAYFVAPQLPSRTSDGAATYAGLAQLAHDLRTAPTNEFAPGTEWDNIYRVLPFAVVLGGQDRWIEALVNSDGDEAPDPTDIDWYHAHDQWHLQHLPASFEAFLTTLTGLIYRRA